MRLLPALVVLFALNGLSVTTALAQDWPRDKPTQPLSAAQPASPKPSQADAPKASQAESSSALPQPKPVAGEAPAAALQDKAAQDKAAQDRATRDKAEKRFAFVVGNESYAAGALPTAANDAGLLAQTLQAAGFEVVGARDLDADTLRRSYADFLKRVTDAGPGSVAFVYMSGYGVQYGNDNYYVPIGADVSRDADIPIETIRLSDLTGPLVALNLKARFMVFDAAYQLPFRVTGVPLAGGFNLQEVTPGSLIAYNAAPGTVAPVGKGNYGVFAQSLAAELRVGGLTPDEVFDRVRLRVNEETKGSEIPWDVSKIDADFRFFVPKQGAPPPAATGEQVAALTTKPIGELPVKEAYTAAVARDSYESYQSFVTSYGKDPLAKRARVLLAARREALTWRRSIAVDTPPAYWSYVGRYPHGPHATAAKLRLAALTAPPAPPMDFQAIPFDVPPPPPDELPFVDQPVIDFVEPGYGLPPLPPPPNYWLPPLQAGFLDLPPPPAPEGLFFLPVPAFVPLPVYYDPPPFVVYPFDNYFYGGFEGGGFGGYGGGGDVFIGNNRVVNNTHEAFPGGGPRGFGRAGTAAAVGVAAGAAAVALPAAAQARAGALERRGITTPAQLNASREQGDPRNGAGVGARNALPGQHTGEAGHAGAAASRPGEATRAGAGQPGKAGVRAARGDQARGTAARQTSGRQVRSPSRGRGAAGRQQQRAAGRQAQRGRVAAGGGRGGRAAQRAGGRPGFAARRGGFGGGRAARGFGGGRAQGVGGGRPAQNFGGGRQPGITGGGRPQGFGGARPGGSGGGFGGSRPGFGGGRPGGFGGGGFGGGRPGGFGGGGFGGGRPGGFGGGGLGGARPGGFGGGRPGGGGGFHGGGGGGFHR